jgi:hypothetical protein
VRLMRWSLPPEQPERRRRGECPRPRLGCSDGSLACDYGIGAGEIESGTTL